MSHPEMRSAIPVSWKRDTCCVFTPPPVRHVSAAQKTSSLCPISATPIPESFLHSSHAHDLNENHYITSHTLPLIYSQYRQHTYRSATSMLNNVVSCCHLRPYEHNVAVCDISTSPVGKNVNYFSIFRIPLLTFLNPSNSTNFLSIILKPLYSGGTYSILRVKLCVQ
jgi:hypothetical protein